MLSLLSPEAGAELMSLIDQRVSEHLEAATLRSSSSTSPWCTVAEAADIWRTTPAAVYKRIKRGQVSGYRPDGSRILLRRDEVEGTGPIEPTVLI